MATNDFLPFCATDTGSNLLTQADYVSDAQRPIGNQPGVARSKLVNKALRQATYITSSVAQFISNLTNNSVLDDATQSEVLSTLQTALAYPYRRPVIQWVSSTQIQIESGLNGVSGNVVIKFPDGQVRVTNNSAYTSASTATVASLSGSKTGGIRTGTVPSNTWGHCYAVKATDSFDVILVIDFTNDFKLSNFATLNGYWGTNGWVYLGKIYCGDEETVTTDILKFYQAGNLTLFANLNATRGTSGILMASQSSGTTANWAYTTGVSGQVVPSSVIHGMWYGTTPGSNETIPYYLQDASGTITFSSGIYTDSGGSFLGNGPLRQMFPVQIGAQFVKGGAAGVVALLLQGFVDGALNGSVGLF